MIPAASSKARSSLVRDGIPSELEMKDAVELLHSDNWVPSLPDQANTDLFPLDAITRALAGTV